MFYFNIRGLAEPIRWMFQIAGVDFIDERISLEDWKVEKQQFSKQVGQLPILYIDESIELTQVHSVMRYVARQLGFNGKNEMETARADEVCELVYDLRLCAVAYKDSFSSKTPDIVRHTVFRDFRNEPSIAKKALMRKHLLELHFPKYFSRFAKLLDEGEGEYIAGSTLTYADFVLANFLDVAEDNVNPDILKDFPTLVDLKDRIFNIPEVQEFIYSTRKSGFYGSNG
ncbi:Glutathione S-transferase 2 [Orchesella cincta]|uniref:Glutathione S-transferase 2 n=1 Tax=Orchesella cincta TaxID=48709 RepID=A0A1D2N8Z9_ORCCI|nr:Glutathione S-transferase 2 [Orchesella cincta]